MHTAALNLGSNAPATTALQYFQQALSQLAKAGAFPYLSSAVWCSPDVSGSGPQYLNASVLLRTDLDSSSLWVLTKTIEDRCGRIRVPPGEKKPANVPLDLDILFYDDLVAVLDMKDSRGFMRKLQLPSPDIAKFAHVCVPLAEIRPDWVHPQLRAPLSDLVGAFPSHSMTLWPERLPIPQ